MNSDKIKFFIKIALFLAITFIFALLVESFPSQKYVFFSTFSSALSEKKYSLLKELNDALSPKNAKIIFLGDSVIKHIAKEDVDKRNIAELLAENSGKEVVAITHDAYHLGVYDAISNYVCKNNQSPELMIIPLNLSSFSPEWDPRPGYQFEYEINVFDNYQKGLKISYLSNRILRLFEDKRKLYYSDWTAKPVYYNGSKRGVIGDYLTSEEPKDLEVIKSKYIFQYLYKLEEDHRKIKSLNNLIKNYQNCNVPFFIYITPIDYKNGEKYMGDDFTRIVKENLNIFKKIEQYYGVKIYDLTFNLDETYFDHGNIPNEHLNEKGRKYIANFITQEINK